MKVTVVFRVSWRQYYCQIMWIKVNGTLVMFTITTKEKKY